jgi:hypothetical protein
MFTALIVGIINFWSIWRGWFAVLFVCGGLIWIAVITLYLFLGVYFEIFRDSFWLSQFVLAFGISVLVLIAFLSPFILLIQNIKAKRASARRLRELKSI